MEIVCYKSKNQISIFNFYKYLCSMSLQYYITGLDHGPGLGQENLKFLILHKKKQGIEILII